MFLLSAAQMREVDRRTIETCGIPGSVLMAAAAAAVERRLDCDFPRALEGTVAILCGGGNNGGDGLVLARKLAARRIRTLSLLFAPPNRLKGDAAAAWSALTSKPQTILSADDWATARDRVLACDLVVDALFGTGLLRPLQGWIRAVVEDLNRDFSRPLVKPIVSVDIPSGMSADGEGPADAPAAAVVRATATVTFTAPKLGHFFSAHSSCVGDLSVAAIGSPESIVADAGSLRRLATPALCQPFLAPRPADSHKGRYGHVVLLAGSRGKSGAAVLAATAALRIGAGLVTVATAASCLPLVASALPELMTEPMPETPGGRLDHLTPDQIAQLLAPATVLALGPGLTQDPEAASTVRAILATPGRPPCVLDADGLNAFVGRRHELHLEGGVLTPHPGEMARLFQTTTADVQSRRLYFAQRAAAETGAIVVLKGHHSIIASPSCEVIVNPADSPGMATAGSGDVLTGIVAGLLAQHPSAPCLELVAAAVFLHGRAGQLAAQRLGELSMIASDITHSLPEAIAWCKQN